jgi:hypothetical protein
VYEERLQKEKIRKKNFTLLKFCISSESVECSILVAMNRQSCSHGNISFGAPYITETTAYVTDLKPWSMLFRGTFSVMKNMIRNDNLTTINFLLRCLFLYNVGSSITANADFR